MPKNDIPYWPGAMKRKTAAQYLDLGEAAFMRLVDEGVMPPPFTLGGRDHWLRSHIDRKLAELFGDVEEDWRTGSPLYD